MLVTHLGRPEGKPIPDLSLRPVAECLRELIDADVTLAPAVVGERVRALTEELANGEILLLENVRFEPGETENDPELAKALAELADLYVTTPLASRTARTRAPRESRSCCRAPQAASWNAR